VRAARSAARAAARANRAAALEADREADRANAAAGVMRRVAARRAARQLDFDPFEQPSPIGTPEPPRKFRRYHDNDDNASNHGSGSHRRALVF
jgi:hypothetical protein